MGVRVATSRELDTSKNRRFYRDSDARSAAARVGWVS